MMYYPKEERGKLCFHKSTLKAKLKKKKNSTGFTPVFLASSSKKIKQQFFPQGKTGL